MIELPKTYEAKVLDVKWYDFWSTHGFFKTNVESNKPAYCIVMPPPNVTGVLHMGHAFVNTLQDVLIRWKRMSGFEVLWVPGTDHAGIATQTVVERHLMQRDNKRRSDYSREEFLKHIWDWKEKSETSILNQIKMLGGSCDWSRLRFTMDEGNNKAVKTVFKKLYDDHLIYRGDYLVNWDPIAQTAIADEEVEYEERQTFLWHIRYPLADNSGSVCVATTRPETMLGDTAVAVSPRDDRYKNLIGRQIKLPLTDRIIPIIADYHVDPTFGTGVVKVTPAHDPNDYQMALLHRLPMINILTPDACLNANAGEFEGLKVLEAREVIVKKLQEGGWLEKVEPHRHRVGISYRSKAVVEPYLSKQWFIKMDGFAENLNAIVKEGKTKLIPSNWKNTYFHWTEQLRDWCISRQIWWGHRIPIWHHVNDERMICYEGEGEPEEVKKHPENWVQDSDVLDTWFSSALWPFSSLGWPDKTPELTKFYPNSTLVTGHDIIFFWVARMLAMGNYVMNAPPFPECFLHGLIYGKSYWRNNGDNGITYVNQNEQRDYDLGKPTPPDVFSKWEKMSKSKGNIINPLEIIEEYGTDAIRMALCASATQSRQIDLDRRRFEEFKNFTNKIWNGARFVLINISQTQSDDLPGLKPKEFNKGLNKALLKLEDHWILSILARTVKSVSNSLEHYEFDQAALKAYDFFWKEFCAYYVEISKPTLFGKVGTSEERLNKQKILAIVLCQAIRLIHPMAPFITEELFQLLKGSLKEVASEVTSDEYTNESIRALQAEACIVAPYPTVISEDAINPNVEQMFSVMEQIIYSIRNIRGEMKLSPGTATDIYIIGGKTDPNWQIIEKNTSIISALIRTQKLEVQSEEPILGFSCTGVCGSVKIMVPLPDSMRIEEMERLKKEKEKLFLSLEKLSNQLANEEFVTKAPPQLIEKQKVQLSQGTAELEQITKKLDALKIN